MQQAGMFPWSSEMSQCHLLAAVTRLPNPSDSTSDRGINPSLTLNLPGSLWIAAPDANSPKDPQGMNGSSEGVNPAFPAENKPGSGDCVWKTPFAEEAGWIAILSTAHLGKSPLSFL